MDRQNIELLKKKVRSLFKDQYVRVKDEKNFKWKKEDQSWITVMDHQVNQMVIDSFKESGLLIVSEESPPTALEFPCLTIDPIDGTSELVDQIPEFCLSLGMMNSKNIMDEKNVSWIYNPVTGLDRKSWEVEATIEGLQSKKMLRGVISRNHFDSSLAVRGAREGIFISPMGSIALKLAFLSLGAWDFVYSHLKKNVWDIVAGTHLCQRAGYQCYQRGRPLEQIDQLEVEGPLLWAKECYKDKILHFLCQKNF